MEPKEHLSDVTDQFVIAVGTKVLQDIDTPSFMRKEYGVNLEDSEKSSTVGVVVEPDEKIVRFLSVIKQKEFVISTI